MSDDGDKQVGEAIRELRTRLGLKQSDVADAMTLAGHAMTQQTVWKIEGGKRSLRFVEAMALSEVLDVSVGHFWQISDERRAAARAERRGADAVQAADRAAFEFNVMRIHLAQFKEAASELTEEQAAYLRKWALPLIDISDEDLLARSISSVRNQVVDNGVQPRRGWQPKGEAPH